MMRRLVLSLVPIAVALVSWNFARADGKVVPPRNYTGSLEEKAQEAIIIFHGGDETKSAAEDLILKIQVAGEADKFAWVIPFPTPPKVHPADPKLFAEVFRYVELRSRSRSKGAKHDGATLPAAATDSKKKVQVISREVVGDYDVAIVKEESEGGLNPWLEENGFQTLEKADDILDFYRQKQYVYACIKVNSAALAKQKQIESQPLRFEFKTGGRDGIYFPMKMTALQTMPFDVNLYVFYRYWLNDNRNRYGYEHRGFGLRYRDWDSQDCVANGGKSYSLPSKDLFLKRFAWSIPTLTKLFQTLHPGEKYYLTNIQARQLSPAAVRQWKDDLWLFPYYTNRDIDPYDVLPEGPAAIGYPLREDDAYHSPNSYQAMNSFRSRSVWLVGGVLAAVTILFAGVLGYRRRCQRNRQSENDKWLGKGVAKEEIYD